MSIDIGCRDEGVRDGAPRLIRFRIALSENEHYIAASGRLGTGYQSTLLRTTS